MEARTILVAGTASHVGKSTVAAGLCRYLAERGVDVAPFKAQNMSNNARAVARANGDGFGEIGVSQYVQANAARVPATTDHNPVLLKPRGDGESQLVLDGEAIEHFAAGEYYERHWERARETAEKAHERLAATHDVIVAEGAGSIAEINLHDRDLANVETARFADADVLLVADIERGGVFASILGTLELLPEDVRDRVVGVAITKFRGDRSLLEPGLDRIEQRTGVPVLGVLPYDDPGLPEEDSVSLPAVGSAETIGDDDGVAPDRTVTIAVPRFPRASNVTDVEPLARTRGVRVRFVPLDAPLDADAVVLTGTKNTVDDAIAAREAGLYAELRAFEGPIVGLCGGYQLLGERLANANVEGTGDAETVDGAGVLPVETRFSPEKTVEAVKRDLDGCGPLSGASGTVSGYEIHMGDSEHLADLDRPFDGEGAAAGDVLGTYLHGLFENRIAREAFAEAVYASAGRARPEARGDRESPYDRAAKLVAEIDLDALGL
ncbi:cobyric acid synthase [Natronomonas salsuginis]|uniref:Probable cobyric acid synthase n=1 Tax=Natronomonas salsuginis TaxID=2217661 RepID=A0A4U5JIM9_9EURY|nr:cobyric acid synthase [Natronomonas salsuginis]TKR25929.1 cobyric acid synthase [Natronomonas salsuginis]